MLLLGICMMACICSVYSQNTDLRLNVKYKDCPSIKEAHFEGVCSSSWAISVAAAANDENCALDPVKNSGIRLSYQNIMECCSKCFAGYQSGCYGGNFIEAMNYMVNTGAVTGTRKKDGSPMNCRNYQLAECYLNPEFTPACAEANFNMATAVQACTMTCDSGSSAVYADSIKKIKSVTQVANTGGNYAELMKKPITDGFILVTDMVVFEDLYSYKKNDIYVHLYGRSVGNVVVNIIGFGTDDTTKQDFWLVRVPWGEMFGDMGVIKVQRGTNNCGIESPGTSYYFSSK